MSIIFITGGNKGLGHETARRLLALGHKVYIGCRDAERGKKAAEELGAGLVSVDVTSDESVTNAAKQLAAMEDHIDVLINNAGVSGKFMKPEEMTSEEMLRVYNTNVFGIVRVTGAFLPLLRKSGNPVIVNVASGLGSFGTVTDPTKMESKVNSLAYCSSKSAVAMVTLQYAKGLPDIKVNCADPGATATDLNGFRGRQTVQEGTDAIVKLATIGRDGPTGTYISREGAMPW